MVSPNPDEVEYDDEAYTSSTLLSSVGVDSRTLAFLEVVKDLHLKEGSRVLEIGCYDGSLMKELEKRFGFDVYGCDPCSYIVDRAVKKYGAKVKVSYFKPLLYEKSFFDAVIFRNVLEHVAYPRSFLAGVREVLKPNGHIVLEIPEGDSRITKSVFGSIVPEHASYFGRDSLINVLSDFRDVAVSSYTTGSLIATVKKSDDKGEQPPYKLFTRERYKLLQDGIVGYKRKTEEIKRLLGGVGDIYFFGANTCSLELLIMGAIATDKVKMAVDDDLYKHGGYIVNYGIPINPRSVISELPLDTCFVVASYYYHDILYKYLEENLKRPCRILRLHPVVELVEIKL